MKKIKAFLLSMLMVVMCLLALVGCDTGKYKFESMRISMAGNSMTIAVGDEFSGMEITEDFMVIELKGGNKAIVTSNLSGEESVQEGTWKKGEEKNEIIITIDDEDMTFIKDGNKLIAEIDGVGKITLSK